VHPTVQEFSPELRLLLALLRSALGTASSASPAAAAIDWTAFTATVERHRVGAFLAQRASASIAKICPPEVVTRLKQLSTGTARQALTHAADQIALMKVLAAANVDVMAVKGLVLSQRLYGGLGHRHVGDIDLLIRPSDAGRADAALQATGLVRFRPDIPLTPLRLKKFVQLKPEFEYYRVSPPLRLELLWRLEGLPEDCGAWPRAVACRLGGHEMRTLPPDLDALYLLQHGARHGWFRLFWLVDAAFLLRDSTLDWNQLMARARELQVEPSLLQAAALAEDLLGVPRPAALVPAAAERRAIDALCAEARRQIIRAAQQHEGLGEWMRQLVYRVRLQKGARRKFRVLAPHLFSPESWRTWSLPDRWFFLYYPATPFLWIWRRLRAKTS
jgi:hypothetical protein